MTQESADRALLEQAAEEQRRIQADLDYLAMKKGGALDKRRIDAAHDAELRELARDGRLL